jgi:hypothetical protein
MNIYSPLSWLAFVGLISAYLESSVSAKDTSNKALVDQIPAALNADPDAAAKAGQGDWRVETDVSLGASGTGAVFRITRWKPRGRMLELHIVGPKGEQRTLVQNTKPLVFDKAGALTVDIPYKKYGIYRGQWAILAVLQQPGQKPEMHMGKFTAGNY